LYHDPSQHASSLSLLVRAPVFSSSSNNAYGTCVSIPNNSNQCQNEGFSERANSGGVACNTGDMYYASECDAAKDGRNVDSGSCDRDLNGKTLASLVEEVKSDSGVDVPFEESEDEDEGEFPEDGSDLKDLGGVEVE
jgi:hypothetical protein